MPNNNHLFAESFKFSEKNKAMLLLQHLKTINPKLIQNIPKHYIDEERDLHISLIELDKKIADKNDEADKLREKRLKVVGAQTKWREKIKANCPEYYYAVYNHDTATIDQIQAALQKHEALISYFVGEHVVRCFTITQTDVFVCVLDKGELSDYTNEETGIPQLIGQSAAYFDMMGYADSTYYFYEQYVQPALPPIATHEHITDLIIIPDGGLYNIPFEALIYRDPVSTPNNYEYLILRYAISYHYSATLWHLQMQQVKSRADNPNLTDFVGFAPVYGAEIPLDSEWYSSNNTRSINIGNKQFKELPYSKSEVENNASKFKEYNLSTQAFVQDDATELNFREWASRGHFLLLSAHAIVDDAHPEKSTIVFTTVDENDELNDGQFFMPDIYTLQINADLVVLSCCETGKGEHLKGEGNMAINRGFLYAGAQNVVYTLFKVYDEPSSQLTQLMFTEILKTSDALQRGLPISYRQALSLAKRTMIQQNHGQPYQWAGFALIGR